MDYEGKYNHKTVASFLINEVHPQMELKYKVASHQKDINDALELQQFFQELKLAAKARREGNIVSNFVMQTILDKLEKLKRKRSWNYNVGKLFQRPGGITFEKELSDVIIAVAASVTDEDINMEEARKQINIGTKRGNVMDENFSTHISQTILKTTGVKMVKKVESESGETQKLHYLANVEGKMDVDGTKYQVVVKLNSDNILVKYYELLSQATFSAKNYDSMSWDEKIKHLVENNRSKLKLGDSNIVRAVYGSLNKMNLWEHDTIMSAIYAGYWAINKYNNKDTSLHFFHLRYVYELTGGGIIYEDGSPSKEIRFLIYNDPHGNIYVKSSVEILDDVLHNKPMFTGNPFKEIYIRKEYFKV